jgi:hypothetical protein
MPPAALEVSLKMNKQHTIQDPSKKKSPSENEENEDLKIPKIPEQDVCA